MADKKYRLSFEMTDGTKQSVEFAVPQGESVTPDYAAAEGEPGHILNRTHWVEKGGMVEILPDTTIEYIEGDGHVAYIPSLVLEVGKTYIVKWNGTEYTCVGQDVSAFMETECAVALGELSDFGLNGNGEPFALIWAEGLVMAETDTTDPITISIKTEREIVHKLDHKYLPDTMYVQLDVSTMTADKTSNEIMIAMRNRQSVFLSAGNELHPCVCCEPRGAFFLTFSATENGGEITAVTQVGAACVKPDGSVIFG